MNPFYVFVLCLVPCLTASVGWAEDWDIRLSVEGTDTTVYRDWYNKAGVRSVNCSFTCEGDLYDAREMIPPESEYLILYFPHNEIDSPYYWPDPCTGIWMYDRRPPTFAENVWRARITSTYNRELEVHLFWPDIEALPCFHSFWLEDVVTSERVNLRSVPEYIFNLPRRSSKDFDLIVKRGVIERMEIIPDSIGLRAGEFTTFTIYLYETDGDSFTVPANLELEGDNVGVILPDGSFMAVRGGEAQLIATYCDGVWADTAYVNVTSSSITLPIELELGWNMISLPIIPYDSTLSTLFPSAINAYWWSPEDKRYYASDIIESNKGYFILSLADTSVTVRGLPRMEFECAVPAGWSMLPALSDTTAIDELEVTPEENLILPLYWYSPDDRTYDEIRDRLKNKIKKGKDNFQLKKEKD